MVSRKLVNVYSIKEINTILTPLGEENRYPVINA